MLKGLLVAGGALFAFLVIQFIYLVVVLGWEDQKTVGLGYYGLPPAGRAAFKRTLRRHALLLFPILRLLGRLSKFTFEKASFRHRGIAGPKGTCDPASFARADAYRPRPEDVFVVTQMKCGTTWMQHVVYEVLQRGDGGLVDAGSTLYAVSPWLEARKSVPMDQAPLIGSERPSRVIKTHLPASHCPVAPEARYVYVARHPVSCFASCADFIATNAGALAPAPEVLEAWFRSPEWMWWGPWPDHVAGWWTLAQRHENVLFVRFEDMKRDLPRVVREVATFLGVRPLADDELARVVEKCGFDYMQRHKDAFEMHPPHILAVDAELFVRGTADRHRDVPAGTRTRLLGWCGERLEAAGGPRELYADLATAMTGREPGAGVS